MTSVYFDSAATTQMRPEVISEMSKILETHFGNPSSTHSYGRDSKALIENARKSIAKHLNVSAGEIIFTSGGTEADNLAINSAVRDLGVRTLITTKVEHHAVLHTIQQLQKSFNVDVKYVKLDNQGHVDYNHLEILLKTSESILVSLMHINNEVGHILDIKKVGELCKENKAYFHSDMVQSIGHFKVDLSGLDIDFAAVSAHKFHGPKGVGFAYVKKNSRLQPLIFGGEQERGLRAGTESVHNIVGMQKALEISYINLQKEQAYIKGLKQYFIDSIKKAIPNIQFNGDCLSETKSTYTLVNIGLPISGDKAAMLLFQLDLKGIACSRGSACQSGSSQASHVLTEMLSPKDLEKPSLRFSFSSFNTKADIDYAVTQLADLVKA